MEEIMTHAAAMDGRSWLIEKRKNCHELVVETTDKLLALVNTDVKLTMSQLRYVDNEIYWLWTRRWLRWSWFYEGRILRLATFINTCRG